MREYVIQNASMICLFTIYLLDSQNMYSIEKIDFLQDVKQSYIEK